MYIYSQFQCILKVTVPIIIILNKSKFLASQVSIISSQDGCCIKIKIQF